MRLIVQMKLLCIWGFIFVSQGALAANETDKILFFVNGIQNTYSKARDTLEYEGKDDTIAAHLTRANQTYQYELVYNPIGWDGLRTGVVDSIEDFFDDILELAVSKTNEEHYAHLYDEIYAQHDAENISMEVSAAQQITDFRSEEYASIQHPINSLLHQINSIEKTAIVVSHSQGNIIAGYAWAEMVSQLGDDAFKKLRVVNVANISRFSPNGLNLTHDGDGALFLNLGHCLMGTGSLENLGTKYLRNTPDCHVETSGGERIPTLCPFVVAEATYERQAPYDWNNDACAHGMTETYLSNGGTAVLLNQGAGNNEINTSFENRFVDLTLAAAASLDRANEGGGGGGEECSLGDTRHTECTTALGTPGKQYQICDFNGNWVDSGVCVPE